MTTELTAQFEQDSLTIAPREGYELEINCRDHRVIVDQPVEDDGKNKGMTPIELFSASLGACVGYFAVRFCRRHKMSVAGLKVKVKWHFEESPHRIGKIRIGVHLPEQWNSEFNERFLRVLEGCTVHQSISHAPEIRIAIQTDSANQWASTGA